MLVACVTDDYETAQNKIVDAFEADRIVYTEEVRYGKV